VLNRLHKLLPLLIAGVFGLALWLLWHEMRQYRLRDIRDALPQLSPLAIGLACGLSVLNYVVLIGYDWLAIRAIKHPLPLRRVALASFTGFATS
jgi:phosphatidylglycerol lysyltransferase